MTEHPKTSFTPREQAKVEPKLGKSGSLGFDRGFGGQTAFEPFGKSQLKLFGNRPEREREQVA